MILVADVDKINTGLTSLSQEVDVFNTASSTFKSADMKCTLEEVKGVLESYKEKIESDIQKINKSSGEYVELVQYCSDSYKKNESNTKTINTDKMLEILSSCPEIVQDYKGNAATALTTLPTTDLGAMMCASLILKNDYMMLDFDEKDIEKIFGSQLDSKGTAGYGYDSSGCDDYARAYCIYIQTGKIPSKASVGVGDSKSGLSSKQISAKNRKEQAQIAFDLLQKGQPSVIHLNSPSSGSGKGHWVTVVGVKKGATRDSVKVDDLIIVDPVTGTTRSTTEDKEYLRTDTRRCSYEPGYHVNYFEY